MKTYRRILAFSAALFMLFPAASCGQKNDEVKDPKPISISDTETEEKTQITISIPWNDTEIEKTAKIFNQKSEKYKVTINNAYDSSDGTNNFEEAMKRIQVDIIAGNVPDIIVTEPSKMLAMIKGGYMADFYPLMENYDGVKKEDFLPNVLESLDFDGKLPALCNSYSVYTVAAKTKFVGDNSENWTLEQAIDCFENIPDGMDFNINLFEDSSAYDQIMIKQLSRESINCKKNECWFSNDFIRAVDFISRQGEVDVINKRVYDDVYSDDYAVAAQIRLTGFNTLMSYDLYSQFGGEDITFVGYPSTYGSGAYTESSEMFGILESSSNKEAAWEFLNLLFDYSKTSPVGSVRYYSFSVLSDAFEIPAYDSDKYNTFAIKMPVGKDNLIIDDATIEKTIDYIKSIKFDFFYDCTLDNVINEEIQEVIGQNRTAEECVEMLKNRISIYISERN